MGHNARQHVAGCASLAAAMGLLVGLPLVSADTRANVAAPLEDRLPVSDGTDVLAVFAGFPGCQGACPTALRQLASVQDDANERFGRDRLAVVFINLHLDTGGAGAKAYAQSFHPDFRGVTATSAERGELKSLLAQAGNRDIRALTRHSANVYVYTRQDAGWRLTRVYPSLPSAHRLLNDFDPMMPTRSEPRP